MNNTTLSPELSAKIERLAESVVRLRLEVPALLFLETHLPLTTVFYNSALLFGLALTPFFGLERIHSLQEILSERDHVHLLVAAIKKRSENHPIQPSEAHGAR